MSTRGMVTADAEEPHGSMDDDEEQARSTDPTKRPATARRVEHLDPAVEDAELVARVLAGDRWAEEALYRRHAPGLVNLAARILRESEAALDVVQDTFVEALDDLESLRAPERLGPWLRRIAVHQVHRRLRRQRLRRALGFVSTESAGGDDVGAPTGEVAAETRVELRLVDEALASVAVEAKLCWSLRAVEGYSVAEVADACRISVSTVKRRVRQAQRAIDDHVQGRPGRHRRRWRQA